MTDTNEPITIGLSKDPHKTLRTLKNDGYFAEMQDAYRFAIAYAARLYPDVTQLPDVRGPEAIFNIGTLDPDRSLWLFITSVLGVGDGAIYKTAERLAEAGIRELEARLQSGTLDLLSIIEELGQPAT